MAEKPSSEDCTGLCTAAPSCRRHTHSSQLMHSTQHMPQNQGPVKTQLAFLIFHPPTRMDCAHFCPCKQLSHPLPTRPRGISACILPAHGAEGEGANSGVGGEVGHRLYLQIERLGGEGRHVAGEDGAPERSFALLVFIGTEPAWLVLLPWGGAE